MVCLVNQSINHSSGMLKDSICRATYRSGSLNIHRCELTADEVTD